MYTIVVVVAAVTVGLVILAIAIRGSIRRDAEFHRRYV